MSNPWTNTVVSTTERVLLLLGWERAVPSKAKTSVYDAGRKQPTAAKSKSYSDLQRATRAARAAGSSWEKDMPSLKLRAVNPDVQARGAGTNAWSSDAFDVAHTGTV